MQPAVEVRDSLGRLVNDGTIDLPTLHRGLTINWRRIPGRSYRVRTYYVGTGEIISDVRDSASSVIISPSRTRLLADQEIGVLVTDERNGQEVGRANFRISPASGGITQELRMQAPSGLPVETVTIVGSDGQQIGSGRISVSELAQGITLRWPRTPGFSYLLDLSSQRNGSAKVSVGEGAPDPTFRLSMSPDTLQVQVQAFRSVYSTGGAMEVASARLEIVPDPVAQPPPEATLSLNLAGRAIQDGAVIPTVYTRSPPNISTEFADKNAFFTFLLAQPNPDGTSYKQIHYMVVNIGSSWRGTVAIPWNSPVVPPGTSLQLVADLYLQRELFPAEIIGYIGLPGDMSALTGNLLRRVSRLQFTAQG